MGTLEPLDDLLKQQVSEAERRRAHVQAQQQKRQTDRPTTSRDSSPSLQTTTAPLKLTKTTNISKPVNADGSGSEVNGRRRGGWLTTRVEQLRWDREQVEGQSSADRHPVVRLALEPVKCNVCGDTGWYRVDLPVWHPEFGQPKSCQCQRNSDRLRAFERARCASNLTDEMLRLTFTNYVVSKENSDARNAAVAFAQNPAGWVVLVGGPGTGKTHLLAAIANHLMHTDAHPLYVVVPDFLAYLRSGFDQETDSLHESCEQRMQVVMRAPVLLLDDLGAEKGTEWTEETLYRLINFRYNERMPTVVVSNLDPTLLGVRIGSRLRDKRLSHNITLAGEDVRLLDDPDTGGDAALAAWDGAYEVE